MSLNNDHTRDTPLATLWRKVDAILYAAHEKPGTFGEIRNHWPDAHPLRVAYLIWNDRRP